MESIRKPARWLVVFAALSLFAAACAGGDEQTAPETTPGDETQTDDTAGTATEGGTVVFGADQEPQILNPHLADGNLFANGLIAVAVLQPLWRITPEFEYEPLLLEGEPEITEDPFTVTYTLREGLQWSDGEPITSEDIQFTQETIMNEDFNITDRQGHDKVTETEIIDDRTITFTFEEPFAPWRTLFSVASGAILPKHVLEGEDFDEVWNDELPVASGPFEFDSWQKGQSITLKRNENYWGDTRPALDEVIVRFIEDSNSQVQALRGGEIDMFYPQPQLDLVEQVDEIEGVTSQAEAGTVWEHVDFNLPNPALENQFVRQAIAQGINRQAIVDEFITPLNPDATPLNNIIYMPNQADYEDHWGEAIPYDPEAAEQLLIDNGCERGDDDVYSCDGERLEFDYATTAGNELRELQFEVMQSQLSEIGIQLNAAFAEAAVVFADDFLQSEDEWDMFNFAWVGSPDPFGGNPSWKCTGSPALNNTKYCNEQVTELLDQTDVEVDEAERARLFNEADALIAQDVPTVPLYQKPTYFAWRDNIQGPADNPTQWGPFWNIEEWTLTE